MTEKRFTAVIYEDYEKSLFFDNEGEERSLTDNEILKLLNELNEELESKEKAHTRCDELYRKLYDENEQLISKNRGLQSELQIFKEDATHSNLLINKLADENEELKQQLKTRVIVNKQYEELQRLKKENEQLKKDATILIYANQEYRKENEQLKQFIQSLAEQSVNGKVMLRDGKVYDLNEILKKGDVE